jgi:hypothetical protein
MSLAGRHTSTGLTRNASVLAIALCLSGCIAARSVEQTNCGSVEPQLAVATLAPPRGEVNVLALSAGGPWGGFGVGFLTGWSQVEAPRDRVRPVFDVAVGVSTGATIVTYAFLGREFDDAMREELFTLSTDKVFRRRNLLAAVLGDSITDTAPLRRRLRKMITPELLDRVADAWIQEGRRLAVIAVDMDCGDPELLDLTAVALQRDRPDRVERYIDYVMASSASPVAFPPVFVDGRMLVDGALRQHIPLPRQIAALLQGREAPDQHVRLHVVINSPLMTIPDCVTDNVLLIALRTSDVWTGERAVDGLALTVLDAASRGWSARYVLPGAAACMPAPPAEDYFRPSFMQCQYGHGRAVATSAADPWRSGLAGLPTSDEVDGPSPHPCRR